MAAKDPAHEQRHPVPGAANEEAEISRLILSVDRPVRHRFRLYHRRWLGDRLKEAAEGLVQSVGVSGLDFGGARRHLRRIGELLDAIAVLDSMPMSAPDGREDDS